MLVHWQERAGLKAAKVVLGIAIFAGVATLFDLSGWFFRGSLAPEPEESSPGSVACR
jgi:hypothetical protein